MHIFKDSYLPEHAEKQNFLFFLGFLTLEKKNSTARGLVYSIAGYTF